MCPKAKIMIKVLQNILILFFCGGILLLQACVEDDLDFPEGESIEVTESGALVTFLNSIDEETFDPNNPEISITYPINLAFNTGIVIQVTNNQGLLEAVESQSSSFYIIGVEFPVEFTQDGQAIVVENESDFLQVIEELDLGTFRTDFEVFFQQCFDFVYPVDMINSQEQEVTLSTSSELVGFINSQASGYQPQFVFPVQLEVFARDEPVIVNSHFDFYDIFNNCQGCPKLFFDVLEGENGQYTFTANFPGIATLPSYDWIINEAFIERDGPAVQGDNQLVQILTPGTYLVCITANTTDCALGTDFCREIVVEDCPDLFFNVAQETPANYIFIADFPAINTLPSYDWFINDQFIESDGLINEGDNVLLQAFPPGTYRVCIRSESANCPTLLEFCRDIVVECPEPFFNVVAGQGPNSFVFNADFPGDDAIIYEWNVFLGQELIASEIDGGLDGDNVFNYEFSPGLYTICIFTETGECPQGGQFCQQLTVE